MNRTALEKSIQHLLDGDATPEEALALQEILKRDPQARALYFSCVGIEQALEFRLACPDPGRDHKARTRWRHRKEKRQRMLVMAAAACVMLVVQFWLFSSIFGWGKSPVAVKLSPYSLCRIFAADGSEPSGGGMLEVGSRVALDQGTMELSFAGGTRAVVQGPAEFTLSQKDEVTLAHGAIWLLVSEKDHGLKVRTASLEAVDLGTDFGVVSDPADGDEVHVFSGTVEVTNLSQPTDKARLHGGEARRKETAGTLVTIPSRPERFTRILPESLPMIRFDFTKLPDGRLKVTGDHPDVEKIQARLVPENRPPAIVPGRKGLALSLDGKGQRVETDWIGVAGNAPRTVTFWCKVPRNADLTRNPAIVGWGFPKDVNTKWKILLTQIRSGDPGRLRLSLGGYSYNARFIPNDGVWHHFAVTYTGRMLDSGHPDVAIHADGVRQELDFEDYRTIAPRNGIPEPATSVGEKAEPLSIGYLNDFIQASFPGMIEDLRIYAGVLPEDAIREQAHVRAE